MARKDKRNKYAKGKKPEDKRTNEMQTEGTHESQSGSKPEDKEGGAGSSRDSRVTTNDPAWYFRFPELANAVSRIPFNAQYGAPYNIVNEGSGAATSTEPVKVVFNTNVNKNSGGIPGICTVHTVPSFGYSKNQNDPLNVAATMLYTHVRVINSGRKNYDQSDMMIYCLAISELFAYVNWAQRIYSHAFMYSQQNLYIGKKLLQSLDVDADSIINNLANYRYRLNAFIAKISSYIVPGDIDLFKRRAFMYAGVYTESTEGSLKDQLYQFAPDYFYKFALDAESKGCLEPLQVKLNAIAITADRIFAIGDSLLENIFGDEDFALMAGDIFKAYGDGAILKVDTMPDVLVTVPVFDPDVLNQIKNATIVPELQLNNDVCYGVRKSIADPSQVQYVKYGGVYQDGMGNLNYRAATVTQQDVSSNANVVASVNVAYLAGGSALLNSGNMDPSPEEVMESTRLTCLAKEESIVPYTSEGTPVPFDFRLHEIVCGSDIVRRVEICDMDYTEVYSEGSAVFGFWTDQAAPITKPTLQNFFDHMKWVPHFKYAPIMYAFVVEMPKGDTINVSKFVPISNLANYTVLTKQQCERLHQTALMSLCYVPGISMMR